MASSKNDYVLSKLQLVEQSINNEESWTEFRPSLIVDYDVSDKLLGNVNVQSTIDLFDQNNQRLIASLREEDADQGKIIELVSRLGKNRENILNSIRILSECLISRINFNILKTIEEKMKTSYINLFAYSSSCCSQNIKNYYLDSFMKDRTLKNMLKNIDLLQNKLNESESNEGIEILEKTTNRSERNGRTLLDYMYINKSNFDTEEQYRIYLENQFKLINYSSITNDFNETLGDNALGKRRIFVKVYDKDINLLNEIEISNDREQTVDNLKDKLIEIYPELNEDLEYLEKKVLNLLDYNGTVELDIISGQYMHDINNKLRSILNDKTNDDLEEDLETLNRFSKNRNLLYLSNFAKVTEIKNMGDFNIEYTKDVSIAANISKLLFNLELIESEDSYLALYARHKHNLSSEARPISLSSKNRLLRTGIFSNVNSMFKLRTDDNITRFSAFLQQNIPKKTYDLNNLMENPSEFLKNNVANYNEKNIEEVSAIDSQLIIENYSAKNIAGQTISDFDNEKRFREKELCNNKFKLRNLILQISYSKNILSTISSIINKLKKESNYKMHFDSLKGTKGSLSTIKVRNRYDNKYNILAHWNYYNDRDLEGECVCPLSKSYLFLNENLVEFEEIWYRNCYSNHDEILNNLRQITLDERFYHQLNIIYSKIDKYNDLLDNILSSTLRYDCENNIKNIPLFDVDTSSILVKFIFSSILNLLIDFDEVKTVKSLVVPLLTIILKDINKSEYFMNITDASISKEINKYKAKQNRSRKANHDRLSKELQAVKKLYRRLNIGDISNAHPEDIMLQQDLENNYFGNESTDDVRQQNIELENDLNMVNGDMNLLEFVREDRNIEMEEDNFRGGIGEGILTDGLEDREENY